MIGVRADDLEKARQIVEAEFQLSLVGHDSSYWGEYYRCDLGEQDVMLFQNEDPFPDPGEINFQEPEFADTPFIAHFNCFEDTKKFEAGFVNPALTLLRVEYV